MTLTKKQAHWNRCDVCCRFIALADFESGRARREMVTPDSDYSGEEYETLCPEHNHDAVPMPYPVVATAMGCLPIRKSGA